MRNYMITLAMTMVMSSMAHGYVYSDYTWSSYGGKKYALTLDVGNWDQMEAEAVAVGGHLVTINDAAEHAWLGLEFEQQLDQDEFLWIGFYQDHDDPDYSEPAGGWKWISGEPVTYLGWDSPEPTNHSPGEDYGTITRSLTNHWNDWGPERPDFYPIHGIIEISEPAGHVAYWSFDDVGDPGHDDSGNGNDGTVLGATSVDGICGKALEFNGSGHYANFGNTIGNFGTADFSVVFWFRSDTERKETVMGKRVFCGEHSFFELNMSHPPAPPGHMLVEIYEGYPSIHGSFYSNQRIDDNQWHLLTITRKDIEGRLYIDGFLDASNSSAEVINMSNSASFLMGNGPCYPVHSDFFSGELDEVRIYDRALSAEEIAELIPEPNIAVSPLSHDFGDVELGTSSTVIVTISNVGSGDLTVSGIGLETDFAITSAPAAAIVVEPSQTVDVEITYTPTVIGHNSAVLKITSNDPDEPVVEVQLSAAGVELPPPPSEQIANILAFFDTSVNDGSLVGDGPGSSAEKRLNALRNMVEAAGDLIEDDLLEEACQQLLDVYNRMDGQPKPPDFVTAEAVPELATMLQDLMTSLGCE